MHRVISFLVMIILCLSVSSQNPDQRVDTIISDSAKMAKMEEELAIARTNEALLRDEIEHMRVAEAAADSMRRAAIRQRIDSLKTTTTGAYIIADGDTLFRIYARHAGQTAAQRAEGASKSIERIGKTLTVKPDSVYIANSDIEVDIMYDDDIIISLTDLDALWADQSRDSLAVETRAIIVDSLKEINKRHGFMTLVRRCVMLLAVVLILMIVIKFINKGYHKAKRHIAHLRRSKLKPIYIQSVEILDTKKQVRALMVCNQILRALLILFSLLLTVPIIFSIFPQTKSLAHSIVGFIMNPIVKIAKEVIDYIPNLFTIFVIFIVIHYIVKIIKYLAIEISKDRLKINGFYPDWAMPTFYILRFLLYAFMIAMIYPYLPGSNSGVFQGISVFVGLIVSLGSSTVIANVIAGLVITYMRPFKKGDRIEVKDITGDVIEKTPLVTRIRTVKNEIVTVPNSFIMSSQTINYSQSAQQYGLIVHTDINIGYEVPWEKVYKILIEAALKTPGVTDDPRPFVLQSSLGDYYIIYQLNAYIRDANLLPDIYTYLHENITTEFHKAGIEVLSPHYYSVRDGNASTIPPGMNKK